MKTAETKRWAKIREFEDAYNRKIYSRMSTKESFKALERLYKIGKGLVGRRYSNSIDMDHISSILSIREKLKPLSK